MVKKKQKQSVLESYNQHTKKNNDGDDQLLAVMHHVCTCESGPGLGMCPRFSKENSLAPAPHAPPFDTQGVEVKSCSQLSLSYLCLIMFLLLRPWAAQVTVQVPRQLAV